VANHDTFVWPDRISRASVLLRAHWLSSTSGTVLRCQRGKSDHEVNRMGDRVSERRRAAQLARHYRDQENLTIAEIARRLGRAEATIKAYL